MSQTIHRLCGAPRLIMEQEKKKVSKFRVSILEQGCIVECFTAKSREEAERKVEKLFVLYQEKGFDISETEYYIEEV